MQLLCIILKEPKNKNLSVSYIWRKIIIQL